MSLKNHMRFVKRIISLPLLFLIGCSLPTEPGNDGKGQVIKELKIKSEE